MSLTSLKRRLSEPDARQRKSENFTKGKLERLTKAEIARLLSEPQKLTDKELDLLTGDFDLESVTDEELKALIDSADFVRTQGGKI